MHKESIFTKLVRRRIIMMLLLLVLLLIVFAVLSDGVSLFPLNLVNILSAMSTSTFLTTGVALLMISGRLDLSTGANGTLCGILTAHLLREGMPLLPTILITLAAGALMGFVNALLVNELRIAPFIATLATGSVATGLVYFIANKQWIDVVHPILKNYGKYLLFGYIPVCSLIAFSLMLLVGVVLHKTQFGRQIYIVGSNAQAAMLSGINPRKMSFSLFILCGLFASAAGITFVARTQSATVQGLVAQRFQGITSAVLGGIAFGGGSGGMAGAFVGLLVLNVFSNGMTVLGINPYWQYVASGLLLLFALTLDYIQKQENMKLVA